MDVFSVGCIAFRLFYGRQVHVQPDTREAQLESYARILGPGTDDVYWMRPSAWKVRSGTVDHTIEALMDAHPASSREYVLGCMAWHPTDRWVF